MASRSILWNASRATKKSALLTVTMRQASQTLSNNLSTATPTISATGTVSSPPGKSSTGAYVSPYKDFFATMQDGKSSLTTVTGKPHEQPPIRYLKCGVREESLRYKTTHYGRAVLAPYLAPMEHRVQLKVFLNDLNLNEYEMDVLKQIVGKRVNEERKELWLTSDQFGSRIENKRHLTTILDRLVMNARKIADEATQ